MDTEFDVFYIKFFEVESVLQERAKLYWFWYWKNFYLGMMIKLSLATSTALLIGDAGLRSLEFYPDEGLLHLLPVIVAVFVFLDSWWDPWEKRKLFLIAGQEVEDLARKARLEWEVEVQGDNRKKQKASIVIKTQNEFKILLRKVIKIHDY